MLDLPFISPTKKSTGEVSYQSKKLNFRSDVCDGRWKKMTKVVVAKSERKNECDHR